MKFSSFKLAVAALGMVSALALTSPASANDMIGNSATGFLGGTLNQTAYTGEARTEVGSVVLEGATNTGVTPSGNVAEGVVDNYVTQLVYGKNSTATLKVGSVSGKGSIDKLEDNTAKGYVKDGAVAQRATGDSTVDASIGSVALEGTGEMVGNKATGFVNGGSIGQEASGNGVASVDVGSVDAKNGGWAKDNEAIGSVYGSIYQNVGGKNNTAKVKVGSVSGENGISHTNDKAKGTLSGSISQRAGSTASNSKMSAEIGSIYGTNATGMYDNTAIGTVGSDVNQEVLGNDSEATIKVGAIYGDRAGVGRNTTRGSLGGSLTQKASAGAKAHTEVGSVSVEHGWSEDNTAIGHVSGNLSQTIAGAGSEGLISVGSVSNFGLNGSGGRNSKLSDNFASGTVMGDIHQIAISGGSTKAYVGSVRNYK